jgi:hypothetical protein
MWRILFLLLILFSATVFAQTQEKLKSYKVDEFGFTNVEFFNAKLHSFLVELNKNSTASGIIINYGSDNMMARNERIIKGSFSNITLDSSKVKLIRGGYLNESKTEFWIIPSGAEPPKIIPTAYKFFEYEKISNDLLKSKIHSLCDESIRTEWIGQIINYGNPRQIAVRVKQIKENYNCRQEFPAPRIVFVIGGKNNKSKTEFWIVPPSGTVPTPNK